eukprot:CAMPEP_0115275576 /NCGR_PEP_ID=MMETSP0270-20121206/56269_1 /TAXON_ID=71861 /ORGANISM="Scrippsiella trochoidea, Strain CCMP3099" /LENGTH=342 /DNA_ID=CAMNT_0002692137 /DNA_START=8 /DNA_END=1033 /DNA_ORIENTATION=-
MCARENGKSNCLSDALAGSKSALILIGATVALAVFLYAVVTPRPCSEVEACQAAVQRFPHVLNAYAMCGLATILAHEFVALVINYRTALPLLDLIPSIKSVFLPSVLLCVTFAVLLAENAILFTGWGSQFLFHASVVPGDELSRDQFVPTVIYAEWLINVPILLVLAGKCALGRPMGEIFGPLIWTNVYILLAWAAHFVEDATARWAVIAVSFALYGWVSYDMAQWAVEFHRSAPQAAPTRILRPCLTLALILLFGVYGIVYLVGFLGLITSEQERTFYMSMNIFSKLAMSLAFAGIKTGAYHDMLVGMLVNANLPFVRQVAVADTDGELDNLDELREMLLK